MSLELGITLYLAVFGLVIGSYLNVLIYRLPRQISTVFPRSRCPRCRALVKAYDNLPLISYFFLRGKCRHCGLRISWRYPAIEAVTALLFVACFKRFDRPLDIVVAALFCAALLVLAMIDFEHYILPDVITKSGLMMALGLQSVLFFRPQDQLVWVTPRQALVGALLGGGALWLVSWAWYLWKGVEGMGFGDVKMLAMIGAVLGWQGVLLTLFLASLSGSLIGALQMLLGRMRFESKLPFGVFLAIGAGLTLFFGDAMLSRYLGLFA